MCPYWPKCGCGTQSGPHTCEWQDDQQSHDSQETMECPACHGTGNESDGDGCEECWGRGRVAL